jgi:threonine aldolase
MRFLAAPWAGLLKGETWVENARHSNDCARLLAQKLSDVLGDQTVFPCEASAVFVRMPAQLATDLRDRGWRFYNFIEADLYRFMCAWSTTEQQIDQFVADVRNCVAARRNDA